MSSAETTPKEPVRMKLGPVKWKHHPELVRKIIKREHFRPKKKGCFENCGRFMIGAKRIGQGHRFEYCEGWIETHGGFHLKHAWILYKGEVVDLTLVDREDVVYGEHRVMTANQVWEEIAERGAYGPFLELDAFGPYAEVWKELKQKRRDGEL